MNLPVKKPETLEIDGNSIDLKSILQVAEGTRLTLSSKVKKRVEECRRLVDKISKENTPVYGINTGFGYFANTSIPKKQLKKLQTNLIKSHATGVPPYLTTEQTRIAMALRLNVLAKGHTGVRFEICKALLDLINGEIYPLIPKKGSVGASGDLIPLAHLALPLIGEGNVLYKGSIIPAKKALQNAGLKPICLEEKEGLGLINGTQVMLAVGGYALAEGLPLLNIADQITALTFEGMRASIQPLAPLIHTHRGHPGQISSAKAILDALKGSYITKKSFKPRQVQDAYSLRCAPQVHGAVRDTLQHVQKVVETECNASTDNPLVFTNEEKILSGGNFHGQPIAMAFDFAAMAFSELGNISERRLEQLLNPHTSGLPPLLTKNSGLCSGYMTLQYMAASRVNENKLLANPASTDSIPGNVGIEDHVSMGMNSANKLEQIIENTRVILACELLAAAQAIDLQKKPHLGKKTSLLHQNIRKKVRTLDEDRIIAEDVIQAISLLLKNKENYHAKDKTKNI